MLLLRSPNPRWPYLGRWSATPISVTPAIPLSLVKESDSEAPSATTSSPPASASAATPLDTETTETTTAAPPASAITTLSPATKTTSLPPATETTASPPESVTTAAPLASVFLTHELNVVAEGTLPPVASVLDENSEKDDIVAESEKRTAFVRSLGAWSKPLRVRPPSTQRLGVSEAVKSQNASFWPSISEANVNGHKHKKGQLSYPVQSQIMEEIPSQIIILEGSGASENEQPIGSFTPLTHNHQQSHMEPEIPLSCGKETGFDVVGETSSYNLTRGGRPIKPTQKIQEMEWTKVSGRGKHGRRGRGNHNH
ncbi:hypothetical protein Bca4012_011109 [Brassica carinata]